MENIDLDEKQEFSFDDNVRSKFEKALLSFLVYEPFFADIIRMLKKEPTRSIPTAGVGFDGLSIVLYYNPEFLSNLTVRQIFGLLKHECYHIIYKHITTRKRDPHLLWNIATDLAINSTIPENELPEGGLIPGKKISGNASSLSKELSNKRDDLSKFIANLPANKSSDWYMEILLKNEEIVEAINDLFKPQHGEGSCDHSHSDEAKDGKPGKNCPHCSGNGVGFDHHYDIDNLSEGDKDYVEAKINDILEKAIKRADEQRSWGSVASNVQDSIRAAIFKCVSWKDVLKYFCGTKQKANKSKTFKRINRKYPYQHPGTKIGRTSNIAVYIDQSGSVSEAELQLFFSTLNDLAKKTTFTIFHFDCTVDEKSRYTWKKNNVIKKAYRTRGGGTNFTEVEKFHRNIQGEFDGYIVFTDGQACEPIICKSKRCWVLLPGTKLAFKHHKNDVVVKMDKNLKG